ncbi:hypothetical protein MMS54_28295, partial [Escherichia coli]
TKKTTTPLTPHKTTHTNGEQIILPFLCRSRSAQSTNWPSGHLSKCTKCALIQTTLRFGGRAVCDAQKTEKRREFSGQDVQL